MEIFLIRHAQSSNNARAEADREPDPGLTELGVEQAFHLAEYLVDLNLSELFTSPFLRTLETSEAIHRKTGLIPRVRTELHEQGGCYRGFDAIGLTGQPGMTRSQIEARFPKFKVESEFHESGWWGSKPYESITAARHRAESLVHLIRHELLDENGRVALVMHADIKVFLLACFHDTALPMPFNSSVTKIEATTNSFRLVEYNAVTHLPSNLWTT